MSCRSDAGFTFPQNSFVDGCQQAAGSSSSQARKERLAKRREEQEAEAKRKLRKRWLPWS